MTDPIRVVVADDHPRSRAAVRSALENSGKFVVCAEAQDAPGAVAAAQRELPQLCLLDINMPGSGIAATATITATVPGASVVMLTVSRQDNDLFDALRAGASGYILKDFDDAHLCHELQRVLDGEACLPGSLVARLIEEFRDREGRRVAIPSDETARLTGREWDVLELMRVRLDTAGIAQRLFVSESTVRSHISSVLRKLRVPDREAAVRLIDRRDGS